MQVFFDNFLLISFKFIVIFLTFCLLKFIWFRNFNHFFALHIHFFVILCLLNRRYFMATIRDVAKEANVSITTVSKILSNDPSFHVSEATRKRVMQAVRNLDYKYAEKKSQIRIG